MNEESPETVRRRLAGASEADACMGMVFEGALGLAREQLQLEPAALAALGVEAGLPKRVMAFLRYPASAYLTLVALIADRLVARGRSYPQALHQLGVSAVASFFASPVGKTMVVMNGGNVHRMLKAAPIAYETVFTFARRSYEHRGERRALMRFRGDLLGPSMQQGIVEQGVFAGTQLVPRVAVVETSPDGLDFDLEVTWD